MSDIEKKAKAMGWVSQEDFRGDPDKWVSAEDFVERGENLMPVMKENLDRALSKIENLENTISENKKTFQKFQEFSTKAEERAYKRAEQEYKDKLRNLKADLKAAAKAEDWDSYDRVEKDLDDLKEPEPPPKADDKPESPEAEPHFVKWKEQNSWYGEDYELTSLADAIGKHIKNIKPHLVGEPYLDEVTKQLKEIRPDKFNNANQDRHPDVEGEGAHVKRKGKKTFSDLPPEAKAEFKDFQKIMPNYKKEDYAKSYWEEA